MSNNADRMPFVILAIAVIALGGLVSFTIIYNQRIDMENQRIAQEKAEEAKKQDELKAQQAKDKADEDAKKKAADEAQEKAAQEELERVSLTKQRVDENIEKVRQIRESSQESYYSLTLRNNCRKPVNIAIRYRTLTDFWMTSGWFTAKPSELVTVIDTTNNINVSVYAESDSGNPILEDSTQSAIPVLSPGPFKYLDYDYIGSQSSKAHFYKIQLQEKDAVEDICDR